MKGLLRQKTEVVDLDENEVYTGVLNIWKSTNGGTDFTKVNNWYSPNSASYSHADIHLLRFYDGVLFTGTDGGFYKTIDGGITWNQIHNGLPKEKGKMAIAVSRSNSEKVYALVESDSNKELGGLFASSNGGEKWSRISSDHSLIQRAFYYLERLFKSTETYV